MIYMFIRVRRAERINDGCVFVRTFGRLFVSNQIWQLSDGKHVGTSRASFLSEEFEQDQAVLIRDLVDRITELQNKLVGHHQ